MGTNSNAFAPMALRSMGRKGARYRGAGVADGLTEAGLERLREVADEHVGDERVPGIVALVALGDEVHVHAVGSLAAGGAPVAPDSIFRITSTSKPITAAATLALVDEGLIALEEPVDRLLPELAARRVLTRMDGSLADTVPAVRSITVRDLLTFTFGFGMVMEMFMSAEPWPIVAAAEELRLATLGPPIPEIQPEPDTWIANLGALPLLAQPGERWLYNTGASVLGVLLARAAGESLGDVLRTRVFEPLGIRDTGFWTGQTERLASAYRPTPDGLEVQDGPDGARSRPPVFGDAAAGLVSTAADLLAFARMLLGGGAPVLSEESARAMRSEPAHSSAEAPWRSRPRFLRRPVVVVRAGRARQRRIRLGRRLRHVVALGPRPGSHRYRAHPAPVRDARGAARAPRHPGGRLCGARLRYLRARALGAGVDAAARGTRVLDRSGGHDARGASGMSSTAPLAAASGTFDIGGETTVRRLGYGTMQLTGPGVWGPPRDRDEALRVLRRAVELGVTFIDTADSYGPFVAEELIRGALHPYPEELVIATKAGLTRSGPGRWHPLGRPEYLRQEAELSLRRLGLERIELFQLHRIDPKVPLAEQVGELKRLQDEGKIRHIGLSEVTVEQLQQAEQTARIASVQNRFNLADRAAEPLLEYAQSAGIAFIPWFPLATGRLARDGGPLLAVGRRAQRDAVPAGAHVAAVAIACDAADSRDILGGPPGGQPRCGRDRADGRSGRAPVRGRRVRRRPSSLTASGLVPRRLAGPVPQRGGCPPPASVMPAVESGEDLLRRPRMLLTSTATTVTR